MIFVTAWPPENPYRLYLSLGQARDLKIFATQERLHPSERKQWDFVVESGRKHDYGSRKQCPKARERYLEQDCQVYAELKDTALRRLTTTFNDYDLPDGYDLLAIPFDIIVEEAPKRIPHPFNSGPFLSKKRKTKRQIMQR